ncbi:pilus assembly protein TadG-related protein [Desulfothermobacter acidiphilus]|uniref:pilus assembly protein TadG-related protein n=1 Tax=Desulfothermobacter acidiphilus TaxID=1938353 RepID=UPI003F88B8CB
MLRRYLKEEQGAVMVLVAVFLVALVGFTALVADGGALYSNRSYLQNVADAAALAGVRHLPDEPQKARDAALEIARANGLQDSQVEVQTPYKGNDLRIMVKCAREVPLAFGNLMIGRQQRQVAAQAVATVAANQVFDYALFSDHDIHLNGSQYVKGSAHSNRDATANGAQEITGRLEAVGEVITNGYNQHIGEIVEGAPHIPFPQYSLDDLVKRATKTIQGDLVYNGGTAVLDGGIWYVKGSVIFNGVTLTGTGTIIAEQGVTFNGTQLTSCLGTIASRRGWVIINGNQGDVKATDGKSGLAIWGGGIGGVIFNGGNARVDGILYAPQGTVVFNGSNHKVHGSVVAKGMLIVNGSGQQFIHDSDLVDKVAPIKDQPRLVE